MNHWNCSVVLLFIQKCEHKIIITFHKVEHEINYLYVFVVCLLFGGAAAVIR